jgi:thioredoxin-related protein
MNGCPYCDEFDDTWDKFKQLYDGDLEIMSFEKSECSKYKIESFPTVRLYDGHGSYKTFNKERTVENLMDFVGYKG